MWKVLFGCCIVWGINYHPILDGNHGEEEMDKEEIEAKKEEVKERIEAFLTEHDWKYDFDEEHWVIISGVTLKNYVSSVQYAISIKDSHVINYAVLPISAKKHFKRLAEFLCRANYGLIFGNFEFDYRDGEIRYKLEMTSDAILADDMNIGLLIYKPALMVDKYIKGIVQVMTGAMKAKEAIALCEQDTEDDTDDSPNEEEE